MIVRYEEKQTQTVTSQLIHGLIPDLSHSPLPLFCCCERGKLVSSGQGTPSSVTWEAEWMRASLCHCYDNHILVTLSSFFPEVRVEPHKKQLHVTLAYHFQASHLPTLEKLAQNIDVKLGCDWVATIFSRDIRFANHEVTSPCGS